ncbi:MAG: hypothetical protein WDO17_16150 [Alphaproteobacteria bacterium]
MWLVLCDANDASAMLAFEALGARGVAPLELVTADALSLAEAWEHRIEGDAASVRFRLQDGRSFDGAALSGVLNRLFTVPTWHWRAAAKADQEYVQQELIAFFLSWLNALPCPVINRPTPQGLCGRWRTESEWVCLAQRAGLPVAPYRQSSHDRIDETRGEKRLVQPGASTRTIIVVGDTVTGASVPDEVAQACLHFAKESETSLIGLDFVEGAAGPWTFAGANPMPDLRWGGRALIDALVAALAMQERTPA